MVEFISLLPMEEEEGRELTEYLEDISRGVAPDSDMDEFMAYMAELAEPPENYG